MRIVPYNPELMQSMLSLNPRLNQTSNISSPVLESPKAQHKPLPIHTPKPQTKLRQTQLSFNSKPVEIMTGRKRVRFSPEDEAESSTSFKSKAANSGARKPPTAAKNSAPKDKQSFGKLNVSHQNTNSTIADDHSDETASRVSPSSTIPTSASSTPEPAVHKSNPIHSPRATKGKRRTVANLDSDRENVSDTSEFVVSSAESFGEATDSEPEVGESDSADTSVEDLGSDDSGLDAQVRTQRKPSPKSAGKKGGKEEKPMKPKAHLSDALAKPPTEEYNSGLDATLPPISNITDIFSDMTEKAFNVKDSVFDFSKMTGSAALKAKAKMANITHDLDSVLEHLNGRKLRVATMCSGTESPVLALGLISDGMLHMEILYISTLTPNSSQSPWKEA